MASLYKQKASAFWWINFRDPADGKIKRKSTGFRIGVGADTRRAEQLRAEYTLRESKIRSDVPTEKWEAWIGDYLAQRYANSSQSLLRSNGAWRNLRMFLAEKEITLPRQLTRDHCVQYMGWRQKPNKSQGKYQAGHNTAQLEIKVLGIIMGEAVLRGYAAFNPCRDLQIKRRPPGKIKPPLTEEVIKKIRELAALEPEPLRTFYQNSFEISYHHGVRISETFLNPLTEVEFLENQRARITFKTKGGKVHSVFLHPNLHALFRKLIADGKTETYQRPSSPSKIWFNFLTRHGIKKMIPGVCFHSLRVTAVTTLARKGIPEKKAMDYIGHASTTIHRTYVRLNPQDLDVAMDAIQ